VFRGYAESYLGKKLPTYFNSGILLINSKVMRAEKFQDRFFDLVNAVELIVAPDQDYYNVMCRDRTHFIPICWNKTPRPRSEQLMPLKDVKLVHYNLAYRPWKYDNIPYADLFWKHAKESHVYDQIAALRESMSDKIAAYDQEWSGKLVLLAHRLWFEANDAESVFDKIENGKIKLKKF